MLYIFNGCNPLFRSVSRSSLMEIDPFQYVIALLVIYNSASFPVFLLKNRTEPKPIGLNRFRFEFFSFSKFYFGYFFR